MTKLRETRNVGIIAHVDAGKTTLTERMLHLSGAVHRTGSVDDGTTTTDHDPLEQDKGITISSAAVHFDWRGYGVNLIDTPGHADFTIEVERSLRVLDGAVVLLDAVSGVQPQTEKVWRQADAHEVPRIVFVNKLDRPDASLDTCLDSLRSRLGVDPVVVGLPGPEGWVDVLAPSADPRRVALVEAETYRAPECANDRRSAGPPPTTNPSSAGSAGGTHRVGPSDRTGSDSSPDASM